MVVTLAKRGLSLLTGASAAVGIVVGQASGVLTVPTSAVSSGTVEVLSGGEAQRVRVTTGLVGPTRTAITAGLKAGAVVVLADLDTPLPTSGTSTQLRGGFGGGTFGGGTFGGVSFGGSLTGGFAGR